MRLYIALFILFISLSSNGQNIAQEQWVNTTYNKMSLEEKIGQLIMVRAYAKNDVEDIAKIKSQIKKYHIGGICYFQGNPTKLTELNNTYQSLSKVPLLTSVDGEWGLAMRYKNVIKFPRQLMLGAIQDNNLIYEMGKIIGEQCQRVGIKVNFAPVVDINNNPNNPVINDRSFGENKYNVIAKSYSYMRGMQDVGVMACAKHFPGHGDTDVDSHLGLPVINHSRERLDSIELVPFKAMTRQGIGSVMVGHLHIPIIDARQNRPTTLSRAAVTDILRKEMAFNGLIFTDAMEMKGVAKHFPKGKADAEAFNAGCDVILLPEDVAAAVQEIKKRILNNEIPRTQLEASVKRILKAKYTLDLNNFEKIDATGVDAYLNNEKSYDLKRKLIENAITLVKDNYNIIPIHNINKRMATISFGGKGVSPFQKRISSYKSMLHLTAPHNLTAAKERSLNNAVRDKEVVIISLENMKKTARSNFGLSHAEVNFINNLAAQKQVILVVFGSPYALSKFDGLDEVVVAYNDDEMTQDIAAQALMGGNGFKGKLPITASPYYQYGEGLYRGNIQRFGYVAPTEVGMNIAKLEKIDSIAEKIIKTKAAPGLQVFVAKDNKVVWNKGYGYFTYKKKHQINSRSIYDVASVTKIAATTISLMKMYDDGQINLDAELQNYISETVLSNKSTLKIREILAHHAKLKPWIPFYRNTVEEIKKKKKVKQLSTYYAKKKSSKYSIPVAKNLYLRKDYRDSMMTALYESDLREKEGYRYSDLGFIMFADIVQKATGRTLDEYTHDEFYYPLGLEKTTFLPLKKFGQSEIVPSEKDSYFRNQTLQGCVHDMACAMMGGVSGHAGLFSTAKEIGTIMQMLLNGGSYGGRSYIRPETVKLFTTRYRNSTRRGLGFDMKELDTEKTVNISELASEEAFGHLRFTGISALADPKYNLVIVIVANRTYPSMDNRKFIKENYRPKIQTLVYESLLEPQT